MLPYRYLRRTPTIISDVGLQRLLGGALALPSAVGLRPQTYWTLFGLLAATGMRPGEPLRLQDSDVNVDDGIVTVRESKGRTRLVPLHSSTALQLGRYRTARRKLVPRPRADTFFVGDGGQALTPAILQATFGKLRSKLMREDDAHWLLHGLRHRFAIRTVERWYRDGKPVEPRMEALSTYVGHANPTHTYWYLTATPELLRLAQSRVRSAVDFRP